MFLLEYGLIPKIMLPTTMTRSIPSPGIRSKKHRSSTDVHTYSTAPLPHQDRRKSACTAAPSPNQAHYLHPFHSYPAHPILSSNGPDGVGLSPSMNVRFFATGVNGNGRPGCGMLWQWVVITSDMRGCKSTISC